MFVMVVMFGRLVLIAAMISTGFVTEARASAENPLKGLSDEEISVESGVMFHRLQRECGQFLTPLTIKSAMLPVGGFLLTKQSIEIVIASEFDTDVIRFSIDIPPEFSRRTAKSGSGATWSESYFSEYLFDLFLNAWTHRRGSAPNSFEELPVGKPTYESGAEKGSFSAGLISAHVVAPKRGEPKVEVLIQTDPGNQAVDEHLVLSMVEQIIDKRAEDWKKGSDDLKKSREIPGPKPSRPALARLKQYLDGRIYGSKTPDSLDINSIDIPVRSD